MRLELERTDKTDTRTIGVLRANGRFVCYTLEDTTRDVKIAGKTAIPVGVYKIIITHSRRFDKPLPLLLNVPNFEGIRIHSGNTHHDTQGCILVGLNRGQDRVVESRLAMDKVFSLIQKTLDRGEEVTLQIL